MTLDDGVGQEHQAFADWDAAYVLGALGPDDRHAYEDHLAGCERCRAAVGELAPLPGLLARTGRDGQREPGTAELPDAPVGPRPDLVDLVVRRERRHRLRRRLLVGGVAALLVVAVAVGVPLATHHSEHPAQTVALAQQVSTTLTATVDLTPVAWGTRLSMDCRYPAAASGYLAPGGTDAGPAVYTLVVTDVDGVQSQVSTWSAVPGLDVRLDAATAVPLNRIASLDVRSAGGATLLSADLVTG